MKSPTFWHVAAGTGALALMTGAVFVTNTLLFLQRSYSVQGTVVQGEVYRGPPRFPGSGSLRVKYQSPDGEIRTAETSAPFLRHLAPDDSVPLLIDASNPARVRLPFATELWSWPLGLCAVGIGLLLLALGIRSVPSRSVHE